MNRNPEFKKNLFLSVLMSIVAFLPTEIYILFKFIVTPNAQWEKFLSAPLWALGGLQLFLFCFWLLSMFIVWKAKTRTVRSYQAPRDRHYVKNFFIFAALSAVCFLPVEAYFLARGLFKPDGFWQNIFLAGFAFWIGGGIQFVLLIIWLFVLAAWLETIRS